MDKQHILAEIQRTATNGKALGLQRFESETGIKVHHWRGKYWVTWGDAIKEAGFAPNDWNPPYEESFIYESLLNLTRRLQKYPSKAEMDFERRSDEKFPTSSAIFRFAPKEEMLRKLLAYVRTHADFADLSEIIESNQIQIKPDVNDADTQSGSSGYVYLVKAQEAYKIGCSRAPYRRVGEIANQSARGAELIHLIPTDDPEGIERYWHVRFSASRISGINKQSGEWFQLSREDVKAFIRRKNFM